MLAQEVTLPTVNSAPIPHNENYKVDVNRGCLIRIHPILGASVYMYFDQPGVFYNDHAKRVPPEFAAECGFEIEPLLKARRKQEAFAKARQAIEAEYADTLGTHEVLEEVDEYRLVHIGNEQYVVEFEDGSRLTPVPVSREMATKAFRSMVGQEAEEDPTPTKK